MANQNCCTNATRIVVTSDDSFIQDGQCSLNVQEGYKRNLGIVESVAQYHAAAVEVQEPGRKFLKIMLMLLAHMYM